MKEIRRGNIHKLFACAKITNEYSLLTSGVVRVCVCVAENTSVCSVAKNTIAQSVWVQASVKMWSLAHPHIVS